MAKMKNMLQSDFEHCVAEFFLARETITIDKFKYGNMVKFSDFNIFEADDFYSVGKLNISVLQKKKISTCISPEKVDIKNM